MAESARPLGPPYYHPDVLGLISANFLGLSFQPFASPLCRLVDELLHSADHVRRILVVVGQPINNHRIVEILPYFLVIWRLAAPEEVRELVQILDPPLPAPNFSFIAIGPALRNESR